MKKELFAAAVALMLGLGASAQQQGGGAPQQQQDAKAIEQANKMKEEAAYYAGCDTADYGVRYRLRYLCNKKQNLIFEEDRVILVRPDITLDMSYQGIGESRWRLTHQPNTQDMSLAYHLTPKFYFYYPQSGRMLQSYRIVTDEFLLSDGKIDNNWTITDEERKIGDYNCRKATLDRGGRKWIAWFTTDLPNQAAPQTFTGLPGVVIDLYDADGEIWWTFNGIVTNIPESKLYIKIPEKFAHATPEDFKKILRVFALSDNSYIQQSGVMNKIKGHYPVKFSPSTGIDGCEIDNPIER